MIKIGYLRTEIINLKVVFQNEYLISIDFVDHINEEENVDETVNNFLKQLEEYFEGKRKEFDVPVILDGTDFQKKVWIETMKIPYGETISYFELAKLIGSPNAVRAVGNALGKNRIPIVIPCHRVLKSDGQLGGFTGGVEIKKYLLELEKKSR